MSAEMLNLISDTLKNCIGKEVNLEFNGPPLFGCIQGVLQVEPGGFWGAVLGNDRTNKLVFSDTLVRSILILGDEESDSSIVIELKSLL